MEFDTAVIVLAAGQGTRMKSDRPKVLHDIGGRAMVEHVLAAAQELAPRRLVVVIGEGMDEIARRAAKFSPDVKIAVQTPPRGTGDAVAKALPALRDFTGVVVAVAGDGPFITGETLRRLRDAAIGKTGAVLGFRHETPGSYGRLVLDEQGRLAAIVEAKEANPAELAITLCNSGVMAFDAAFLNAATPKLRADNAKGEYYLTDLAKIASADGAPFAVIEGDKDEARGFDSRAQLAEAEAIFQRRARLAAMANGATLIDPQTVYFSYDTALGRDVIVEPGVFFGPGVVVEDGATIRAYSHLEGARVRKGAVVGPFARLRPGAEIGEDARVGNFVEVKNARLDRGAKANHLAYLGDATIGAGANIGAGTITCNYDGFDKHRTEIGAGAFVGSNSSLVAPVAIGAGAYVGSGSVITRTVEPGDLAVARGRQAEVKGWATKFRDAHAGRAEAHKK